MNRRKNVDYSAMYGSLNLLMADNLDDMDLYFEIGRIICDHPEKGAAVIAAEYLQAKYPDRQGFSPRNLRRMRMAYLAFADFLEEQAKARLDRKCGHFRGLCGLRRAVVVFGCLSAL